MNQLTIAIVYHSGTGNTAKLAQHIAEGVKEKQAMPILLAIRNADIVEGRYRNEEVMNTVLNADAVIFGSPTYMGSVSAQFKSFADASSEYWANQQWAGKIAAGFTIGSNPSGDQLSTLQYLMTLSAQHGMLWTGINIPGGSNKDGLNRLGSQSGLMSYTRSGELDSADLNTARYLGARVAELTASLPVEQSLEKIEPEMV